MVMPVYPMQILGQDAQCIWFTNPSFCEGFVYKCRLQVATFESFLHSQTSKLNKNLW